MGMESEKNSVLSICIPVYNNAESLRKCLKTMIPDAERHNIPIYVSDNASTDNTVQILESFKKIYPFLYFKTNEVTIGVDANILSAARMASTKYVWPFGSRMILLPGILDKIYKILNESDLDLLVLNYSDPTFMVPESKKYCSAQKVFRELAHDLGILCCQVFPSEAWKSESALKYIDTEFIFFGLALEFIANKQNLNVFFISDPCITSVGKSSWLHRYFQVWANYKKTIYSLPKTYTDDDKEFVIKKIAQGFFGNKSILLNLRVKHIYDSKIFGAFREDLVRYGNISPNVAYAISRFPVAPLTLYYRFYDALSAIVRTFIHQKGPLNPIKRGLRISYT
jgi:abequosyltransferase